MNTEALHVAAARHRLGLIRPEDLTGVAVEALARGLDSRSLRMLAGLTRAEAGEARALFDRSLRELGILLPERHEAVRLLARLVAGRILHGAIQPYRGAEEIWDLQLLLDAADPDWHELDPFAYGAVAWESRLGDRPVIEGWILDAARDLLARG